MREQLRLLHRLQSQDAEVQEMVATLSSLPKQLEDARRALAEMEKRLSRDRDALMENEAFQRKQEEEQKSLSQQISKSKSKLSQVRNLKESNAIQREQETNRRALDLREADLKKLSQALQDQRARIADQEAKLQGYANDLLAQEDAGKKRLEELKKTSEQAQVVREELLKDIDSSVLARYETLRKRKRWPILASAERSICSACHISISPQIYNHLFRGQSIENCANCHRILYLPTHLQD